MKNLYVSDLDGTLLRSTGITSEYTNNVINELTKKGMIFSYATARSLITAKKVTEGICAKIPLIVYNGAFIMDNVTGEILAANYFGRSVLDLLDGLFQNEIYPIVYAYIDGKEKFSFIPEKCTRGMISFLDSRKGDIRTNAVSTPEALKQGDIFYITCIDEPQKLEPLYEKCLCGIYPYGTRPDGTYPDGTYPDGTYGGKLHCVYQKDIYTNEQWLEIMPEAASKSNAVIQLKKLLGCDRLIVFGDGKNDIDMFEAADECYAVQNAHEELKRRATAVIGSNDEDGVAGWLMQNYADNF